MLDFKFLQVCPTNFYHFCSFFHADAWSWTVSSPSLLEPSHRTRSFVGCECLHLDFIQPFAFQSQPVSLWSHPHVALVFYAPFSFLSIGPSMGQPGARKMGVWRDREVECAGCWDRKIQAPPIHTQTGYENWPWKKAYFQYSLTPHLTHLRPPKEVGRDERKRQSTCPCPTSAGQVLPPLLGAGIGHCSGIARILSLLVWGDSWWGIRRWAA